VGPNEVRSGAWLLTASLANLALPEAPTK